MCLSETYFFHGQVWYFPQEFIPKATDSWGVRPDREGLFKKPCSVFFDINLHVDFVRKLLYKLVKSGIKP